MIQTYLWGAIHSTPIFVRFFVRNWQIWQRNDMITRDHPNHVVLSSNHVVSSFKSCRFVIHIMSVQIMSFRVWTHVVPCLNSCRSVVQIMSYETTRFHRFCADSRCIVKLVDPQLTNRSVVLTMHCGCSVLQHLDGLFTTFFAGFAPLTSAKYKEPGYRLPSCLANRLNCVITHNQVKLIICFPTA